MQPIHELLSRIQWDKDFALADFMIGFYDRVEEHIIRKPLKELQFDKNDHYFFHFLDDEYEEHCVPLHRIKEVFRNGERIWHREH
jgi:uncharacterized protein (UPF0248 family)